MSVTVPFAAEPPGIKAAGQSSVLIVPAIAEHKTAVTMAELSAGVNMSCALHSFAATGTQTKTERRRHCYTSPREDLGRETWTIEDIEYDWDPQDPDGEVADSPYSHYASLEPGTAQYVVERLGMQVGETWAASQWVRILPVRLGVRVPVPITLDNESQTHSVRQTVAVIGEPSYVQITA